VDFWQAGKKVSGHVPHQAQVMLCLRQLHRTAFVSPCWRVDPGQKADVAHKCLRTRFRDFSLSGGQGAIEKAFHASNVFRLHEDAGQATFFPLGSVLCDPAHANIGATVHSCFLEPSGAKGAFRLSGRHGGGSLK
jgi:hypothetical protein